MYLPICTVLLCMCVSEVQCMLGLINQFLLGESNSLHSDKNGTKTPILVICVLRLVCQLLMF